MGGVWGLKHPLFFSFKFNNFEDVNNIQIIILQQIVLIKCRNSDGTSYFLGKEWLEKDFSA
jgi:hypothetical protein